MAEDSSTPISKNGTACSMMPRNTVMVVFNSAPSSCRRQSAAPQTSASSNSGGDCDFSSARTISLRRLRTTCAPGLGAVNRGAQPDNAARFCTPRSTTTSAFKSCSVNRPPVCASSSASPAPVQQTESAARRTNRPACRCPAASFWERTTAMWKAAASRSTPPKLHRNVWTSLCPNAHSSRMNTPMLSVGLPTVNAATPHEGRGRCCSEKRESSR